MLNITSYQRNANQNYNEVSRHSGQNGHHEKNLQTINAGESLEKSEPSLHCYWKCKLVQPLWRTVLRFLKKLKMELPYDPAILLLGRHSEKTIVQKDTSTPLFTVALFTTVRIWNQPKCPPTEEWIKKTWYVHAMKYYSAIQRNKIVPSPEMWKDLEIIIPSEARRRKTSSIKYHIILLICGIQKNGTEELICKAEIETQMQRTYGHQWEKWGWDELGD